MSVQLHRVMEHIKQIVVSVSQSKFLVHLSAVVSVFCGGYVRPVVIEERHRYCYYYKHFNTQLNGVATC